MDSTRGRGSAVATRAGQGRAGRAAGRAGEQTDEVKQAGGRAAVHGTGYGCLVALAERAVEAWEATRKRLG